MKVFNAIWRLGLMFMAAYTAYHNQPAWAGVFLGWAILNKVSEGKP